jgi:hypothetical protein
MWMRPGDRVWLVQQPQRESARGGAGCVAAMMVAAKPAESYSLYRVTETDNPDESLCEHLRYVIVCDDRSDGAVVACSVRPADDDRDGDGVQVKICAVSGGVVVRGTVVTTRSKADDGAPLAMHSRWSTASAGCVAVLNEADDRVWIVSVDPAITPDDDDDVESSAWSPLCATRAAYEGGKGHVAGEDYEDDGPAGGRGGPDMARWLAAGSRVVLTRVSVSGLCLERTGGPEDQMRMRAALDVADYDTALSMGWRGFETGARVEWCTNWRDNAWEEGKDRAAYVPPEGVTDLARYSTASITQDGRPRRAAQDWPTLGEEMHAAVEIMRAVSAWVAGGCTGAKCSCGAACSDFAESFRGCGSVPTDGLTAARDKLRRALDLVVANARLEDAFAFAFDGDGSDCHGRVQGTPDEIPMFDIYLLARFAGEPMNAGDMGIVMSNSSSLSSLPPPLPITVMGTMGHEPSSPVSHVGGLALTGDVLEGFVLGTNVAARGLGVVGGGGARFAATAACGGGGAFFEADRGVAAAESGALVGSKSSSPGMNSSHAASERSDSQSSSSSSSTSSSFNDPFCCCRWRCCWRLRRLRSLRVFSALTCCSRSHVTRPSCMKGDASVTTEVLKCLR